MNSDKWKHDEEMTVVASVACRAFATGVRDGLSKHDAALAVLIGCFSVIRVEGLNEERLLHDVRLAVPHSIKELTAILKN